MERLAVFLLLASIVGLSQAFLPLSLFGEQVKRSMFESQRKTREAEAEAQNKIEQVVQHLRDVAESVQRQSDMNRRDAPTFGETLFKPLLLHLEKNNRRREAEQNIQEKINTIARQLDEAASSFERESDLNRRESPTFADLFGLDAESSYERRDAEQNLDEQMDNFVKALDDAAAAIEKTSDLSRRESPTFAETLFGNLAIDEETNSQRRDAEQNFQAQLDNVVHEIDAATGSDEDDEGNDLTRRGGQVFGFGGTCGQYGNRCVFFGTHCCGKMKCRRQKWYHVRGRCS